VHGVDETQAFAHTAGGDGLLDLIGDVHEVHARGHVHREVDGVTLHA
jgi:hypothetical protein